MNIVIVHNSVIPARYYGGIERVIWDLGKELASLGHVVTYLVPAGSLCPFAKIQVLNPAMPINIQIPENADLVHYHFNIQHFPEKPYLVTIHGNLPESYKMLPNSGFVSRNHAKRHGAEAFVYNGLDWDEFEKVDKFRKQNYVHFLGKAAWKVKNVKGAIRIAAANNTQIKVMGGTRLNFKMGFRYTLSKWAQFYGMVDNAQKAAILKNSGALVFPVLWDEPFGLAIIESLFFGCPVLATRRGSLPEIVCSEFGFLSDSIKELEDNFEIIYSFDPERCRDYAIEVFNSKRMALNYLVLYEKILNGELINPNLRG